MSSDSTDPQELTRVPICEMPECSGDEDDAIKRVRDPEREELWMCESCLNDGWRAHVTVLYDATEDGELQLPEA